MKEQPSNANRRKFDEDFKQSALKMIEHGQSVRSVAQGLGVSENLLHKWKQARHANRSARAAENIDAARAAATSGAGAGHFKKSLEHFLPPDLTARGQFIRQTAREFPLRRLCRVVAVSPVSYYRSLRTVEPSASAVSQAVTAAFLRQARRYGSRRIHAALRAEGWRVGRQQVRQLMAEQGLRAIQPRSFVPRTTDSRHRLGYAANRLLELELPPAKPNEVLAGDITHLPLQAGGVAYLATWADLFSRLVVRWEVLEHLQESLIIAAFEKAWRRRVKLAGALVHSDRGGQYASTKFRQLLQHAGRSSVDESGG